VPIAKELKFLLKNSCTSVTVAFEKGYFINGILPDQDLFFLFRI